MLGSRNKGATRRQCPIIGKQNQSLHSVHCGKTEQKTGIITREEKITPLVSRHRTPLTSHIAAVGNRIDSPVNKILIKAHRSISTGRRIKFIVFPHLATIAVEQIVTYLISFISGTVHIRIQPSFIFAINNVAIPFASKISLFGSETPRFTGFRLILQITLREIHLTTFPIHGEGMLGEVGIDIIALLFGCAITLHQTDRLPGSTRLTYLRRHQRLGEAQTESRSVILRIGCPVEAVIAYIVAIRSGTRTRCRKEYGTVVLHRLPPRSREIVLRVVVHIRTGIREIVCTCLGCQKTGCLRVNKIHIVRKCPLIGQQDESLHVVHLAQTETLGVIGTDEEEVAPFLTCERAPQTLLIAAVGDGMTSPVRKVLIIHRCVAAAGNLKRRTAVRVVACHIERGLARCTGIRDGISTRSPAEEVDVPPVGGLVNAGVIRTHDIILLVSETPLTIAFLVPKIAVGKNNLRIRSYGKHTFHRSYRILGTNGIQAKTTQEGRQNQKKLFLHKIRFG